MLQMAANGAGGGAAKPSPQSLPFNIRSEVQLDDGSLGKIRNLSSLSSNFRQALQGVRRIQRGSPGAGQLGTTVSIFRSQFDSIASECQQVFTKHSHFPGMKMLENQLGELKRVLGEQFNDGGNEPGYSERVRVLEKLHYTNGMLRGVVETMIEHHEYWKCKLTGQPQVQRCLNFDNVSALTSTTTHGHLQNTSTSQSGQKPPGAATLNQPLQLSPIQPLTSNQNRYAPVTTVSPMPKVTTSQGLFSQQPKATSAISSKQFPFPFSFGVGIRNPPAGGSISTNPLPILVPATQSSQRLGSSSLGAITPSTAQQPTQAITTQSSSSGATIGTNAKQQLTMEDAVPPSRGQQILYLPRQPQALPPSTVTGNSEIVLEKMNTSVSTKVAADDGISIDIEHIGHMCDGITELWKSKRHTDVTFLIQGDRVSSHRIILASQSLYFDRLLFGDMREAQEDEIKLNDVESLKAFQLLIQYAYSGCMKIQNEDIQDALDVLKLSDQFGFELLKNTLGDRLSSFIGADNILLLLSYADMYQVTGLLSHCYTYVDGHAEEVLSSEALTKVNDHTLVLIMSRDSLCVPETLIFRAVVRWKESQSDQVSKEVMKSVLSCVRLTEIPPKLLLEEVSSSSLFEMESIMMALKVQILPDLESMKPRGVQRIGKNLLDDSVVGDQYGGPFSTCGNCATLSPLRRESVNNVSPFGATLGTSCSSSMRVTLRNDCLVNTIELEGFFNQQQNGSVLSPGDTDELPMLTRSSVPQFNNEKISYTIQVSKNGQDWIKLFDYSDYSCHRVQKLHFPTLAVRFLEFQYTKGCHQMKLKLHKCLLVKDRKPFKFRANGVIAPLFPLKPLAYQMTESNGNTLVVVFNQPYSISMLSFTLCGPADSIADVRVISSSNQWAVTSPSDHELCQARANSFNESLTVKFKEQVITTITVEIQNVIKRNQETLTLGQSNPQQKNVIVTTSQGQVLIQNNTPVSALPSNPFALKPNSAHGYNLAGTGSSQNNTASLQLGSKVSLPPIAKSGLSQSNSTVITKTKSVTPAGLQLGQLKLGTTQVPTTSVNQGFGLGLQFGQSAFGLTLGSGTSKSNTNVTTAATAIPTTSVNQGLGFGSGTVIPKTNTAASTLFTKPKFDLSQGGLQLGQSALGGGLTLGSGTSKSNTNVTTAATAVSTTRVNQGLGFGSGTVIPKTNTAASTLFTKPKFDLSQGGLQLGQSALGGGLTLGSGSSQSNTNVTAATTAVPTTRVNQGLGFGSGTVIPKTNTAASTLFTKPKFDLSQGGLQLGQSALGGGLTLGSGSSQSNTNVTAATTAVPTTRVNQGLGFGSANVGPSCPYKIKDLICQASQ